MRKRDEFLVFGSPAIEEAEIEDVAACMRSGWLGSGPEVARFEGEFAGYKGAGHAVALSSCTAALHLSILAAGVGPGDEVITTPLTFCATVNAIIHSGARPVLADVDPLTMNIDPARVESRLTKRTRAIIPVHFAGRPCDMDSLCRISERNNLKIIEDCAHAVEAEYQGRKAGTFGDFGCFSFYVTKNIVTGEGGMVLARQETDASRIRILALHGLNNDAWARFRDKGYRHYYVVECGYKYNMMDMQAVIGLQQLARVERNWRRRLSIWQRYSEAFSALPVTLPAPFERDTRHACHLYTILVDENRAGLGRDAFLDAMMERNIGVGVHYLSIPEHPYYQDTYAWCPGDYPHAMRIGRQTVSLPLSPGLSDRDVEDVIEAVVDILEMNA